MHSVSPNDIQELATKAFVLEALTDKPGCTTRYEDLPGKPLQDFVIAGINSSAAFGLFAQSFHKDPSAPVYFYNLQALKASNKHKSPKYINFGLLEIMFPVVVARLTTSEPSQVVDAIIDVIKNTKSDDVAFLLETRQLAWSTSQTTHKIGFEPDKYKRLKSVWDFYMEINKDFTSESSNFQWTEQFKKGLPILKSFFDVYTDKGEVIGVTKTIFEAQKIKYPEVAVGIIADMCAAAIFLWLSFNDHPA